MWSRLCLLMFGLLGAMSSGFARNDEAYLCIADFSTGFSYEPKRKAWEPTNFKTNNVRFTLSKNTDKWQWKKFGSDSGYPCSEFNKHGTIFCGFDGLEEIAFSRTTMRFRDAYLVGYIDGKDNDDNTPAITIGTCTKL